MTLFQKLQKISINNAVWTLNFLTNLNSNVKRLLGKIWPKYLFSMNGYPVQTYPSLNSFLSKYNNYHFKIRRWPFKRQFELSLVGVSLWQHLQQNWGSWLLLLRYSAKIMEAILLMRAQRHAIVVIVVVGAGHRLTSQFSSWTINYFNFPNCSHPILWEAFFPKFSNLNTLILIKKTHK